VIDLRRDHLPIHKRWSGGRDSYYGTRFKQSVAALFHSSGIQSEL